MRLCRGCERFVRESELSCPFCRPSAGKSNEPLLAAGLVLGLGGIGCSGGGDDDGIGSAGTEVTTEATTYDEGTGGSAYGGPDWDEDWDSSTTADTEADTDTDTDGTDTDGDGSDTDPMDTDTD